MQKEVIAAYPAERLSLYVVWMPMVLGDSNWAAHKTGRMFNDQRVRQFYDPNRVLGRSYVADLFPDCIKQALAATPTTDSAHAKLEEFARAPPERQILWDAVLSYPPGIQWADKAPQPLMWSKQTGFYGAPTEDGENRDDVVTAIFFKDDCRKGLVESDWFREVRQSMKKLLGSEITYSSSE